MKKILLFVSVIALSSSAFAQFENGDFENWHTAKYGGKTNDSLSLEVPNGFDTGTQAYTDLPQSVFKDTDVKIKGSTSARLETFQFVQTNKRYGIPGYLGSAIGDYGNAAYLLRARFAGQTLLPLQSHKYTGTNLPTTITFQSKAESKVANDSGRVLVTFTKYITDSAKTKVVGRARKYFAHTTDFQKVTVDYVALPGYESTVPDSMGIVFINSKASYIRLDSNSIGTKVWIDDLQVSGVSNTSIFNNTTQVQVNIFPNPAVEYFTVYSEDKNVAKVEVYNILGMLVANVALLDNHAKINCEQFAKGQYIVKLLDAQNRMLTSKAITVK